MKTATFCHKRRLFIKKTTLFYKKLLCTSLEKTPTSNISIYKKTTQFLELIETPVTEYKKSTLTLCIGLGASIISCRGGEGEYSQE